MLPSILLALGTGTWVMLGLIGALLLVGVLAVASTETETPGEGSDTRYVFGLGKHPRLVPLPQIRDLPATPEDLGGAGLRKLASKADAKTSYRPVEYRLPDGRERPYELSEDLPEGTEEIRLQREDLIVRIDSEGLLTASRPLRQEERTELEEVLLEVVGEAELRADRREWDAPSHTAEAANARRA